MTLFSELKRRNVFRVAAAYAVVAWLIVQVGDVAADNLGFSDWFMPMLFVLLGLGFPVALFLAWAFELTPEGLKRETDVPAEASIAPKTARKLDRLIMAVLVLAVAVLVAERFWPLEGHDAAEAEMEQSSDPTVASSELSMYFAARGGDLERANRLASEIDARPAGPLQLMTLISNCACGAPFDLEATPNLAARLDEAGLDWPPTMPIEWPLKDW